MGIGGNRKILNLLNGARARQGMTMAEVLISAIIFSVVLAACYALLIAGSDSWETNEAKIELQQELRKAVDWIAQDLRQAGSVSITNVPADGAWYTLITFRKASGVSGGSVVWDTDATKYSLGGTDSAQLQRQVGSQTPRVIAQNFQSLQFRRQSASADVVDVAMQAQKKTPRGKNLTGKAAIQEDLSFKVHVRN
jgi:prepilin-type N-terminal cleavage/methylation domain-containing protein